MAFNFNWSPLIADTDRVREMLTSSLNKSPKPPIIVDDIIVNELNLGSTPPELEILEIGDLAEDKFRGIFKMSYTGDAYLTLKTKVQANPLKTFLSPKKNTFASPMPLAAGSGLVIPLQITLSEIRLSGFVILVFSKQKGITLVFRNDPIESLKVSSTFDSIPFVRDYLQRTIESQLRVLFMEDLPAIIHRLSLRMFNADYHIEDDAKSVSDVRRPVDPFATPSQRAIDGSGLGLDEFSLDTPTETYASFSQKNLLRLAALSESQRTLSLFTPAPRDTVYRAWASSPENNPPASGIATPAHRPTTLSRIQSTLGSPSAMSSAASQASDSASQATRPSLVSMQSAQSQSTVYGFTAGRPRPRKRKHRVVNLRKNSKTDVADLGDTASVSSGYTESASRSAGPSGSGSAAISVAQTDPTSRTDSRYLREGEIETPPRSPEKRRDTRKAGSDSRLAVGGDTIKRRSTPSHRASDYDVDATPRASMYISKEEDKAELPRMKPVPAATSPPAHMPRTASELSLLGFGTPSSSTSDQPLTGGILSHAWMLKAAAETAKRVEEEKAHRGQRSNDPDAPPAYVR